MTQTAEIIKVSENSSVIKNRKEKHFYKSLSLLVPNNKDVEFYGFAREVATLRFYATDTRIHAVLWINNPMTETYQEGGGMASGYGYHKPSAAASTAFRVAGVILSEPIDGRGDGAIEDALTALAVALGHPVSKILRAHA